MSPKSISELTADSWIFLTGATGFVGGCLLERILKIDPGPERVFVLVRKKRGFDPKQRLDKILSSPLFSAVPAEKIKKIEVIPGDIAADGLGLHDSHSNILISKCTHVLHSAAFISFAAQLALAAKINLRGTRNVLELAKKMKRLRAMVHVSTAYVSCTIGSEYRVFQEKVYPSMIDPIDFLQMLESLSAKEIEERSDELIGNHPNTYTFTKQLTENLLANGKGLVPLAIVRPGIILNSWSKPVPGWVDNVNNGACGFIAGATKGIFRTFQAEPFAVQDVIPVDMVVSTILAAALKVEQEPTILHVYHCTSGMINPTTWGRYCSRVIAASRKYPCENAMWYPTARVRSNPIRNYVVLYIFQILPVFILDVIARVIHYKKMSEFTGHLLEIQQRYAKGSKYTSYFSTCQWSFDRSKANSLFQILPPEEEKAHPMNPSLIEWDSYFEQCVIGMRRYFHKEPVATTEIARQEMRRWKPMARASFENKFQHILPLSVILKDLSKAIQCLRVIATLAPFLSFTMLWCMTLLMGFSWSTGAAVATLVVLLLMWL